MMAGVSRDSGGLGGLSGLVQPLHASLQSAWQVGRLSPSDILGSPSYGLGEDEEPEPPLSPPTPLS